MGLLKWYSCKRCAIISAYIKVTISVLWAPHPAHLRAEAVANSLSEQQGDPAAPASDHWVYFVAV